MKRIYGYVSLIIVIVALVYIYCGGVYSQQPEVINSIRETTVGEITSDIVIEQTFEWQLDSIHSFEIQFATLARKNTSTINVQLIDEKEDEILYSNVVDTKELDDNKFKVFKLSEPIKETKNKVYKIRLSTNDGTLGNAITVWKSNSDYYFNGQLFTNGIEQPGDICLRVNSERISPVKLMLVTLILGISIVITLLCFVKKGIEEKIILFIKSNLGKIIRYPLFMFISSSQFIYSLYVDKLVFNVGKDKLLVYLIIKGLCFLVLTIVWQVIPYLYTETRRGNVKVKLYVKNFVIYLGIMMFFLLLTWPGIWRGDDVSVLQQAYNLDINYWQHYLTSVFMILSLMIIPAPSGVVIIQICIVSLIVSYIVTEVVCRTKNKKIGYLMYIPFLLPAIITNNLFVLRTTLYGFIEVFLFAFIFFNRRKQKEIDNLGIVVIGILIGIISCWRSEGIYMLIMAPLLVFSMYYKELSRKKVSLLLIILMSIVLLNSSIQNNGKKGTLNISNYKFTAFNVPLSRLLRNENLKGKDIQYHIEQIDKVIDVQMLKENEDSIFLGAVREYTDEEWKQFIKSYVYIVINNLPDFLRERGIYFAKISGFDRYTSTTILDSSSIFDEANYYGDWDQPAKFLKSKEPPIDSELRKEVIRLLESREDNDYMVSTKLSHLLYNVLIWIISAVIIMCIMLKRKKWTECLAIMCILIQFPIIFSTSPAPYFMYYIPLYICCSVITIFFIINEYDRKIVKGEGTSEIH